jgi:hypothetical protein
MTTKKINTDNVADIRRLLASWLEYACENKHLPFEKDSGYIIQIVNALLRSLEMELKEEDAMERIAGLERRERERMEKEKGGST